MQGRFRGLIGGLPAIAGRQIQMHDRISRITSYNVCYTKLLRPGIRFFHAGSSVGAKLPQKAGNADHRAAADKHRANHTRPASMAPGPAGGRADNAAAEVVTRQIER